MSGEYETAVTAAPRPRKVRSSSGSTGVKDEREALAAAAAAAAPLRLVLAVDSGGDPPGIFNSTVSRLTLDIGAVAVGGLGSWLVALAQCNGEGTAVSL